MYTNVSKCKNDKIKLKKKLQLEYNTDGSIPPIGYIRWWVFHYQTFTNTVITTYWASIIGFFQIIS
jgi:hypothetical protein